VAEPFERRPAAQAGVLTRWIGGSGRRQAIREIEDLLGGAERVREVSREQVAEIAARHGVELGQSLHTARKSLYRRYLEHCLQDQAVSEEESADLVHLRQLLQLGDADVAEVQDHVTQVVYGRAIEQVLADHRLDPDEEQFLKRLRQDLAVPETEAERLYAEGALQARQKFMSRSLSHDHVVFAPKERTLDLHGSSTTTIEEAVGNAVTEAAQAIPELDWLELTQVRGEVEDGRVARWQVSVKAGLRKRG
jgi:flavin-binding protein dodecin